MGSPPTRIRFFEAHSQCHANGGRAHAATNDYTQTWCTGGEIGHVVLSGGARVRYVRVGNGPPLFLMHTVRTQLDHFQLVIPQLTDTFTVYAVDFPGMGWSDIVPDASSEEPALRAAMVSVIEELDVSDLRLAGESMGATLALTLSVDLGERVRRVVAFNTYDFADGVKRASLFARLVAGSIEAPVVGPILALKGAKTQIPPEPGFEPFTHARSPRPARRGVALSRTRRGPSRQLGRAAR